MSNILVKAFTLQFDSCVTANLISSQNILASTEFPIPPSAWILGWWGCSQMTNMVVMILTLFDR